MTNFYDGTKLLSLKDINNKKPEIYICTTNRSAGKTTYFNRLLVNRFIKQKKKFVCLYRYNYELFECHTKIFKEIKELFFNDYTMTSKSKAKGLFYELYLNDENCGYALALNSAEQYKKYSHFFNDVDSILFDEFQSEFGRYISNEVTLFRSIHATIARGGGKQIRSVPTYLVGNPITLINPYYVALNISDKLQYNTKFLRGTGYVLEQGFNISANQAQKTSAFNAAFYDSDYSAYLSEGVYLKDNLAFIERPSKITRYICTIKFKNKYFAIKECAEDGFIYCDNKVDYTFPSKIAITTNDHAINYVMLEKNSFLINNLRSLFTHGAFRFKNLECKEAILNLLSL